MVRLPKSSDLVEVDEQRCQDIVDYVSSISDELRDGEVTARQACYLPNVQGGNGPLIGNTGVKGLLIAAGHTCWGMLSLLLDFLDFTDIYLGIQNGPATGKLISEFVFDGAAKSAKISSLDPRTVM
jgi:glycine/D-amino acid oxidase-like deaminating enzyme